MDSRRKRYTYRTTKRGDAILMIRTEIDQVRDILNKYPEAYAKILDDGEVNDNEKLYDELYEYFLEDMPYGVQKARTGDPVEWMTEHLDYLGLLTKETA
jgi:hypothetical protein